MSNRRDFLKKTGGLTAGIALGQVPLQARNQVSKNKLPGWKGFNLLDFFNADPDKNRAGTEPQFFQWMADWGFNFVRLPMAYPSYLKFDRTQPIDRRRIRKVDKRRVAKVDQIVERANAAGLHVSLNLHRAPGFCVNAGFYEPYNLWQDEEAMDDFCWHWKFWARRYRGKSRKEISFDLLNEPCVREDMNDQHSHRGPIPGALYRNLVLRAMEVIHKANPDHLIIADGNNVGSTVIPEITDLDVAQSCRGYNPGAISHHKASWSSHNWEGIPDPTWPGNSGDRILDRSMLEKFYEPWIDLVKQGVGVHCGECGCYNKTPHHVFLAWFADVLEILGSSGIGFALWEFRGDFGILNSGRSDVDYEDWYGYQLDRKLLDLLQSVEIAG